MPDKPPTPKTEPKTSYIVLRQFTVPPSTSSQSAATVGRATEQWDRAATVKARSAEHAIKTYAATLNARDDGKNVGTFVAIPNRSWTPLTVKAQVQTTLTITAA